MLWGATLGGLEIRKPRPGKPGYALAGRFPYNSPAVLSDGGRTGRPRKERIAPGAFNYRIEQPDEDIHLLVGHSYDKPLASKRAGTLTFDDTPDALLIEADITDEIAETTWARDAMAALAAGLIVGLSPGFRLPPERAVKQPETVEDEGHDPERGMHNAIIRTVHEALLYEVSLVTRPAYPEAQVEARNWQVTPEPPDAGLRRTLARWRA